MHLINQESRTTNLTLRNVRFDTTTEIMHQTGRQSVNTCLIRNQGRVRRVHRAESLIRKQTYHLSKTNIFSNAFWSCKIFRCVFRQALRNPLYIHQTRLKPLRHLRRREEPRDFNDEVQSRRSFIPYPLTSPRQRQIHGNFPENLARHLQVPCAGKLGKERLPLADQRTYVSQCGASYVQIARRLREARLVLGDPRHSRSFRYAVVTKPRRSRACWMSPIESMGI